MRQTPTLIIVSGHPATGKTTLSVKIAEKFKLPLVSKDGIKETIWDAVGWKHDKKLTFNIGGASYDLIFYFIDACLAAHKSLIVEANFYPERHDKRFNQLSKKYNAKLIQIYCMCEREALLKRFKNRMTEKNYHRGHLHNINMYGKDEVFNGLGRENMKLATKGATIDVDTTNPKSIDYKKLFRFIKGNF